MREDFEVGRGGQGERGVGCVCVCVGGGLRTCVTREGGGESVLCVVRACVRA